MGADTIRRVILLLFGIPAFFALFLFVPAGTATWATGWLFNDVRITYENSIGTILRDNATAPTEIVDPLMIISKTAPAEATPGETITYTISYQNIGTDTAYNVVITETYPPGVTFVSSVPPPDSGNNVWFIGDIPPGFGGSIDINVSVDPSASGVLVNFVEFRFDFS